MMMRYRSAGSWPINSQLRQVLNKSWVKPSAAFLVFYRGYDIFYPTDISRRKPREPVGYKKSEDTI
jgi:hypothetical protein